MNVTIRKASISDIQTLLDINYSSFEANATYDPYIDMNWIHSDEAKEHFTEALTNKNYYTVIAEVDTKPAGYIVLGPIHFGYRMVKTIELDNFAVLPAYRSKGVGKMLIIEAKRWAKSKGFQTIYVISYSKNNRAVIFYKLEGFMPINVGLELTLV